MYVLFYILRVVLVFSNEGAESSDKVFKNASNIAHKGLKTTYTVLYSLYMYVRIYIYMYVCMYIYVRSLLYFACSFFAARYSHV